MTRHVADESLPDLAEGLGSEAERAHVAACGACAARLAEVRSALEIARGAGVPEPSPLYWDAMRRSVGRRIGEEGARRPAWAWLAPVAAAAALVAAMVVATGPGRAPAPTVPPGLPAWSALPDAEDDPSLAVLEGFAAESGDLAVVVEDAGLGAFVAGLSEEDSRALADSLRGGVKGGES